MGLGAFLQDQYRIAEVLAIPARFSYGSERRGGGLRQSCGAGGARRRLRGGSWIKSTGFQFRNFRERRDGKAGVGLHATCEAAQGLKWEEVAAKAPDDGAVCARHTKRQSCCRTSAGRRRALEALAAAAEARAAREWTRLIVALCCCSTAITRCSPLNAVGG